jgi:hypothetical protein
MDSKRKSSLGTLSYFGELNVGGHPLKKITNLKILQPPNTLPKHPFEIYVEAESEVKSGEHVKIRYSVGLKVPVDISSISLGEAYNEAKTIVFSESSALFAELQEGMFILEAMASTQENTGVSSETIETLEPPEDSEN